MPTRTSRPQASFTLIELLVVIAIVSVLAAMLLPALSQARERGRRAGCLSNQKQLYLGALSYYGDQADELPWTANLKIGFGWTVDSALSFGASASMDNSNVWVRPSGSATLVVERYLTIDLWECPSDGGYWNGNGSTAISLAAAKNAVATNNGYVLSGYAFRYNHQLVDDAQRAYIAHPLERKFAPEEHVLFYDASSKSRANASVQEGAAPYQVLTLQNTNHRWAHVEGGNMTGFDGAAKWVPNFLATPGSSQADKRNWPASEWGYGMAWLTTKNGNTGYDQLYAER